MMSYHGSDDDQDLLMQQQWDGLKKIIEKDPTNLEAQYAFINNMLINNPSDDNHHKITVGRR